MQANKTKRETRSEIENARVNETTKKSTGELRSEGKRLTSIGAGVITVMAITQLTSRGVTCGEAMEERERREKGEEHYKKTRSPEAIAEFLLLEEGEMSLVFIWGVYPLSVFHTQFLGQICIFFFLQTL